MSLSHTRVTHQHRARAEACFFLSHEASKPTFNPKKDISEDAVQCLFEQLTGYRQRPSPPWMSFATLARDTTVLFPDRRSDLCLDEDVFNNLQRLLSGSLLKGQPVHYARLLEATCVLFPHRRSVLKLDERREELLFQFHQIRQSGSFKDVITAGGHLAVIFHEAPRLTRDSLDQPPFMRQVDECNGLAYIELRSQMRIIEAACGRDGQPEGNQRSRIEGEFQNARSVVDRSNPSLLARLYVCLSVLSAERVEIGEFGIRVVHLTDYGERPPLPLVCEY